MTTLEIYDRLADEHEMPADELAEQLSHSYDGFTEAERQLSPDEVELHRTTLERVGTLCVSRKVKLHYHFDFDPIQIPFGD